MILVLRPGSSDDEIAEVLGELQKRGCEGRVVRASQRVVVHVVSGRTRRSRRLLALAQVEAAVPTSGPRVRREGWRFFPYHFLNWSACGITLVGLLVFLAGQYPPGIGAEIDLQAPPAELVQPWYLRAPLALVRAVPAGLGWIVLLALVLAVILLPVLDRSRPEARAHPGRRLALVAGAVAIAAAITWKELAG